MMKVTCEPFSQKLPRVDLLCLPMYENKSAGKAFESIDRLLGGQLKELLKGKHFTGKSGEELSFLPFPRQAFKRLMLAGLGKEKEFDLERLRKAGGIAGRQAAKHKAATIAFIIPESDRKGAITAEQAARAVVEGVNLGSYLLDKFKTGEKEHSKPRALILLVGKPRDLRVAQRGARIGHVVSDMQNHCRDLVGSPSNVVTPAYLADEARRLGREHGLAVRILNRRQIERLKMGAFLAVARASAEPPQLIRVDYRPKLKARKRVILVGKGITFDTGGITLKPGADMFEMKGDMNGAAAVLCTMAAVARLKIPLQVTAIIPTCENMPGGRAYKPGDVLTTSIGKTIEVISTDAEGRLLLADVLGYAAKMKPDYLIDIATLTGAVIVALGHVGAAILSTSESLASLFVRAAAATGEKVWRLPLWPEYERQIKSLIADMKNSGGRPGGTAVAATILKQFVGDVPWLHIDIASVDFEHEGTEYTPKGSTGFGVRLLTEALGNLT